MMGVSDPIPPSHVIYADETQYNVGRYRGLAAVSSAFEHADAFSTELRQLLHDSGLHEFKWAALRTARQHFAASKLLTWTFHAMQRESMHVDVLTWDVEAHHHPAPGQSGITTLQQMYLRLLGAVANRYQPRAAGWRICPDEQSALDWAALARQLAGQGGAVERMLPCRSHEEPLVQVADLFAGLAVYSRSVSDRYEAWQHVAGIAPELLHPEDVPEPLTGSDRVRYEVLAEVLALCAMHHIPIQLQGDQGLSTPQPALPLHFWAYQPGVPEDSSKNQRRSGL